jgi:spheroidene monooxygenase
VSAEEPALGSIAGLTRASIRPQCAARFWRRAPPAERSLDAAPGCLLAIGLGEAPLLRQATFTVWESVAAMNAYARSGAHLEAIRASHDGGYFSESMFVRFVPEGLAGTWKGRSYG